jgi:serine/threonine-protein kinase HipA
VSSADGGIRRLAVEDAGQLLGLYPADKYNADFESVAQAVLSVCAARAVAARNVLQQITPAGRTSRLSRRKLLTFAAGLGLPTRAAERALDEVVAATGDLVAQWDAGVLPFDAQVARTLHRVLTRRRRDLTD